MIVSQRTFFARDHFEAHKGHAPPYLCELVVHCLELVSQLVHRQLPFRFKGGNSLLILLEHPQRFSIDVDIVTTVSKQHLIDIVESIATECPIFNRFEMRQPKTKPWLPMISFKLFFDSLYQNAENAYVMLDAVLEQPPYPGVTKGIQCGNLYQSNYAVELPSISGLIADKLLCLGPSTMGIPLGKNKEAQRIKHLFDIAHLLEHPFEMHLVHAALLGCMQQENRIQKSDWSLRDVIQDTVKFCQQGLDHAEKPDHDKVAPETYLGEIVRGFDEFKTYLFRTHYTWHRFQQDCRRILALLAQIENVG